MPMESAGSLDNPYAAPAPQSRVPDSWSATDPIARAPFSLNTEPQTVAGYEIPLALNFRPVDSAAPSRSLRAVRPGEE